MYALWNITMWMEMLLYMCVWVLFTVYGGVVTWPKRHKCRLNALFLSILVKDVIKMIRSGACTPRKEGK